MGVMKQYIIVGYELTSLNNHDSVFKCEETGIIIFGWCVNKWNFFRLPTTKELFKLKDNYEKFVKKETKELPTIHQIKLYKK